MTLKPYADRLRAVADALEAWDGTFPALDETSRAVDEIAADLAFERDERDPLGEVDGLPFEAAEVP